MQNPVRDNEPPAPASEDLDEAEDDSLPQDLSLGELDFTSQDISLKGMPPCSFDQLLIATFFKLAVQRLYLRSIHYSTKCRPKDGQKLGLQLQGEQVRETPFGCCRCG